MRMLFTPCARATLGMAAAAAPPISSERRSKSGLSVRGLLPIIFLPWLSALAAHPAEYSRSPPAPGNYKRKAGLLGPVGAFGDVGRCPWWRYKAPRIAPPRW